MTAALKASAAAGAAGSRRKLAATTRKKRTKPAPKPAVVRAYRVQHHGNARKVAAVAAVLRPYQDTMGSSQSGQWRAWLSGERFWNRRDPAGVDSVLSERFKRSAQNQVVAALDSWLALAQDAVSGLIRSSSLPGELKADLHWLNRSAAHHRTPQTASVPVWVYTDGVRSDSGERKPADAQTLRLLQNMLRHTRRHLVSVPNLRRVRTMTLDGTVAQVEHSQPKMGPQPSPRPRGRGSMFPLWLRVSTTEAGQVMRLPLASNHFFDQADGELSNFAQVTVTRDQHVKITLTKRTHPAAARDAGMDVALDWGMRSLLATQFGDQLGTRLYPWLTAVDAQLTALTKDLQRQGIKPGSNRRYRNMQRRIGEHVRNEVGRIINRLLEVHDVRSFTVEKLDFRGGGLSRRMNRILTRAGRGAVSKKLNSIGETHGITTVEVNPAHTSRECAGCHYVDPKSRQGPRFRCRFCGKRSHADTNGARVISHRRSVGAADALSSKGTVLRRADARFEAAWGLRPGSAEKLRRRPKERPASPTPKNRRAKPASARAGEETNSRSS